MGTSKSFSKINHPQWGNYSDAVTRNCDSGNIEISNIKNILGQYVHIIGGSSKVSSGKSNISGRAGIKTANKLTKFLAKFVSSGYNLESALKDSGFVDLNNKSVSDVINHLVEYCSGVAALIDDRAAKAASKMILEELTEKCISIEELQEKLKAIFNKFTLEDIIIKYFGYYIYEHQASMFYEKLVREKGQTKCSNLFKQIKNFIIEHLKGIHKKIPLNKIKWGTQQSEKIIQNIFKKVLIVFENYEN